MTYFEIARSVVAVIACSAVLFVSAWAQTENNARPSQRGARDFVTAELLEKLPPRPYAPPQEGRITIFRGMTLIDGTDASSLSNMAVVVDGQFIRDVLPATEVSSELLDHAEIVELEGCYLIPGLIDAHQHIATPPNPAVAKARLRRALFGGVTAVRIMGDDLRLVSELSRQAIAGEIPSPDMYMGAIFAGPAFFEDPRVLADSVGYAPGASPWMQKIDDKTDLELAVARARGAGAVAIKTYANLAPELIARIVDEAHRQGMMVWSHTSILPAKPSEILAAGVDSMSHVCSLGYEAMGREERRRKRANGRTPMEVLAVRNGDNVQIARMLREMKRRKVIFDPTGMACAEIEQLKVAPEDKEAAAGLTATLLRQMLSEGVEIAAGTDLNATPGSEFPPLHEELEFLVDEGGMSPAEALRAATATAARVAGVETMMGTITPGKLANMVVLEKDPLADVKNLQNIVMIVKRGRRFDRSDYRASDHAAP